MFSCIVYVDIYVQFVQCPFPVLVTTDLIALFQI